MESEAMRAQWERYGESWSAVSDTERRDLLTLSLTPDFFYVDPRIECRGHEDIVKLMEAFQQREPGGSFALKSMLTHHDAALVNWQWIQRDGAATSLGFDCVRFDISGRTEEITGFFVPAA